MITLVLGGARSGKSLVAERLAEDLPAPVTFVATGAATDEDMASRIIAHRERRPAEWTTVEVERGLVDVLAATEGTVVVDALGSWVAMAPGYAVDVAGLCRVLRLRSGDSVVVSDEVGLGVDPYSETGRRFRDAVGSLNREIAEIADEVIFVVAGRRLPLDRIT